VDKDEPEKEGESEPEPHPAPAPVDPDLIARRQLLGKMSIAVGCVGGAALAVPIVGFIVAPLFGDSPREWRAIAKIDQFKIGETVNVVFVDASPLPWAGVTAKTAAWLRRLSETEFEAFSVNCAHLGCPVRWMPDARLFMCPCHGGVYYEDGSVAAGPPEHGLSKYACRVRDGQVEVRTDPIPLG
jgi:menaquinol-cytochrome c reductase iron-sulfur subunit